jgi:hypothetical protein
MSHFGLPLAVVRGRKKNASAGGGPSTTPSWIAVGTADDTGTASATPAYGTNAAGDLFVMIVAGRLTAFTTPAGWTLQGGPNDFGGRRCYILTRDTRSAGSESGTVAVTLTANSQVSTIHTFRNVAASSFVEDVSTAGTASNGNGPLCPAITAGGNARLAIFASADGNMVTYGATSGETGGTWTLRAQWQTGTGSNCSYGLYTAALSSGGTITGGAGAVAVDEHSTVGFALVGT